MIERKILASAVILLFLGMSVISSTAIVKKSTMPTSFYDGNTLYVGGSGEGNYSKIQDAIDNASDGDIIFVFDDSSPYYENVLVDKSINLIGENRGTTVIDGGGVGDVVYVSADEISMTGFTIENGGSIAGVAYDSNGTLVDRFYDSGLEIRSNSNSIFGNIIGHKCAGGIFIKKSSDNSIFCNKIFNNCYKSNSIVLFNSSNNVIFNNNVSNNRNGIFLCYSNDNIIFENNIYSNNKGLLLNCSSNYNKIYHNNFIENVQNAYDECDNTWDDGYPSGGNYWDDYNGVDNDGDGIGDIPYNIHGGDNQDKYPLMEPFAQHPKFDVSGRGGIGLKISITNVGDITATNVEWSVSAKGGLFGLINLSENGSLNSLDTDESISLTLMPFGFGSLKISIEINASYTEKQTFKGRFFVILFIVFPIIPPLCWSSGQNIHMDNT